MACGYVPAIGGGLAGMLDYVDCQAQTIGVEGYLALAAPGSAASVALTALLTILVALYGYRLLLGHVPGVQDAVLTLVKIGIVVAFATNWSAYRTLFYDVVLHGPAELASAIGRPSGLPGAGGGLVAHLDAVDQQFQALAIAEVGAPFPPPQSGVTPPMFAGFDTFALGGARVVYIVGALGTFAAVRLTAGLLLALGPMFVAFLLFDATRSLFIGWLRVMIGTSLGALASAIVLGVELALLEPWLVYLVAERTSGQAIAGAPAQLLAATAVFAIALAVSAALVARVAWGLDPTRATVAFASSSSEVRHSASSMIGSNEVRAAHAASGVQQPRAAAIAEAVSATSRREANLPPAAGAPQTWRIPAQGGHGPSNALAAAPPANGRSATDGGRRTGTRISASAARRDRV